MPIVPTRYSRGQSNAQVSDWSANINTKGNMATEVKSKAIEFNGAVRSKDVDGERRITFVASSDGIDRHYERVDVESLRLPLKDGGTAKVAEIGSDGIEGVDIPLMLNHSGDVTDVIGSVRKAYFENGELIFEAGISSREVAQEVLTLIEEGHLSNAFSITMIDFDYQDNTIYDAEVIEVSVVYRGANKEARLLAIKSLLGGTMPEGEKEKEIIFQADEQAEEAPKTEEEPTEEVEEAPAEEATKDAEPVVEAEAEAEETVEAKTEPEEEPKAEEEAEETKEETEVKDEIAKEAIVAPVATKAVSSDYLKSKQALKDFKDIVLSHPRGTNDQIMKAWMSNLKEKAVAGDAIMPSRIENIFFKAWNDNPSILSTFRQLAVRRGAVYAMAGTANGSAKGHVKGAEKVDQTITATRRDVIALGIYKKLPIDLQDLFDDESGELLAFRVEELADRVAHAIAVGAILGDTTNVYLSSGRGLNPMATDINATTGFGTAVATKVAGVASDTAIQKAIKTVGAVQGDGAKALIVPTGWKTEARLALIGLNYPVADLEEFIGARIFELDEMTGSGFDMIAYAEGSYVLVGEANASVRTDFDLTYNQDVMLVERYVGGSASGYKTVAGYVAS